MALTLPTIEQVIATIESNNNQFALRFELNTFIGKSDITLSQILLNNIRAINGCNLTTAKMIASTSFGLYQIMGANLYLAPIEITATIVRYLNDYALQHICFSRYLIAHGLDKFTIEDLRDNADKRTEFASRYNGPGDVADYAELIRATIARLTVNIPEQFK